MIRKKFPIEIEFEPLQICNAACFSCPYSWLKDEKGYTKKRMTLEQIKHILTDFGKNLREKYNYHGKATIIPFRYSDPLITPYIEDVFIIAKKYNLTVRITTNAKSFNLKKIKIFEKYIDQIEDVISISIIGSNKKEVENFMAIDLDKTMDSLEFISTKSDVVKNKIKVSLRITRGTEDEYENLILLQSKLNKFGIDNSIMKKNWMENRLSDHVYKSTESNFVSGCSMFNNKILRRINVMVDGNVVLCDDDSTGRKIFGNIFKSNIDTIWNGKLLNEHNIIYNQKYNEQKNNLICNSCSRAILKEKTSTYMKVKKIYNKLHSSINEIWN